MSASARPPRVGVPATPDELLTTTRSVRLRLDLSRPVDLDQVRECVEIALQAPNGGNTQRWHWLVVAEDGMRKRVAEVYRRAFEARYPPTAAAGVSAGAVPVGGVSERMLAGGRHLAEHLHEVPVLVIPCLELGSRPLTAANQAGVWGSLLPAAWSYMLAARARGLGTAWTTVHLDAEQEVADLLGLPGDVRQGALIPTAHVLGDGFGPAPRRPVDSVLHLDGWGGTGWGGGGA
ncbi:nitroreductase family protein [Kitasatospora purpeofusca]|uniref:nitroreductase family protein n=1 Tax=Kitasatospora purpeofusca TaxID=67352 RepID=UPI002A5A9885|nr:nitroreductase family protein [Kitasatospora purpeofusca]MDY0814370.1 nitroreductase family protein [Kitasatospora purpeofusca]